MLWKSNVKKNDNFAIKMVSMENVEGESSIIGRSKKKESNLLVLQVITLGD